MQEKDHDFFFVKEKPRVDQSKGKGNIFVHLRKLIQKKEVKDEEKGVSHNLYTF